jgi:hypothetical protein
VGSFFIIDVIPRDGGPVTQVRISSWSPPVKLPEALTIRNCSLEEGANGEIINSKTGKPFDGKDPCIEKGVQIAYNAAAYQATLEAVKDFLRATFNIKK